MKRSFRCLLMMVAIAGLCLICPIFFSQTIQDTITPTGSTLIDVGKVFTQNLFWVHVGLIGAMFITNLIFFFIQRNDEEKVSVKPLKYVIQIIVNIAILVAGGIFLYLSQTQLTDMVMANAAIATVWKMLLPFILFIAAWAVQFVVDLFVTTPGNRPTAISIR